MGHSNCGYHLFEDKDESQYNYIFVHIPRTAGRTIRFALERGFGGIHKTIRDYVKELGEETVRNRFKFTVVRNPWDRAVSLWCLYLYVTIPSPAPQRFLNFEEWLFSKEKQYADTLNLDELHYCRNGSGEILIDEFLRFENLQSDFSSLAKKLNANPNLTQNFGEIDRPKNNNAAKILMEDHLNLQLHTNQISEKDRERLMNSFIKHIPHISPNYKDMYQCQESINLVEGLNHELIEKFGYSF